MKTQVYMQTTKLRTNIDHHRPPLCYVVDSEKASPRKEVIAPSVSDCCSSSRRLLIVVVMMMILISGCGGYSDGTGNDNGSAR